MDTKATDPVFDETKPYGEVHNDPLRRYWQNPYHFDGQKKYVPEGAVHPVAAENDKLNEMHWKRLQKMVKERGGVYINKHQALKFLRESDVG